MAGLSSERLWLRAFAWAVRAELQVCAAVGFSEAEVLGDKIVSWGRKVRGYPSLHLWVVREAERLLVVKGEAKALSGVTLNPRHCVSSCFFSLSLKVILGGTSAVFVPYALHLAQIHHRFSGSKGIFEVI